MFPTPRLPDSLGSSIESHLTIVTTFFFFFFQYEHLPKEPSLDRNNLVWHILWHLKHTYEIYGLTLAFRDKFLLESIFRPLRVALLFVVYNWSQAFTLFIFSLSGRPW